MIYELNKNILNNRHETHICETGVSSLYYIRATHLLNTETR
jgi:hypothetical protein